MRDKNRIPIILAKLEKIWSDVPDLRLGQLICNLSYEAGCGNDPYFMEDEVLEILLNLKIKEWFDTNM